MLVFRIQHRIDQTGPYMNDDRSWQEGWHTEQTGRPAPHYDGMSMDRLYALDNQRFGFDSMEALRAWFRLSERQALAHMGYVLTVWKVPEEHVLRGRKQVCFNNDHATKIREERLEEEQTREQVTPCAGVPAGETACEARQRELYRDPAKERRDRAERLMRLMDQMPLSAWIRAASDLGSENQEASVDPRPSRILDTYARATDSAWVRSGALERLLFAPVREASGGTDVLGKSGSTGE